MLGVDINGNTPTGVGKTAAGIASGGADVKHPHGRGEDGSNTNNSALKAETPPRAWGRLAWLDALHDHLGNTPTGVGKTMQTPGGCAAAWKHPHGRGEDLVVPSLNRQQWETPPRAWGRPAKPTAVPAMPRNTPTGVGKTHHHHGHCCEWRKHPHGRGEDALSAVGCRWHRETPPRAWGRPGATSVSSSRIRNTPTGVGKTDQHHSAQRLE